jgi:ActR/RegA family two-component response regulator
MDNIRILVVDNKDDWCKKWVNELCIRGIFSVDTAITFLDATTLIQNNIYEGAIIDKGGKDLIEKPSPTYDYHDGLRLIEELKKTQPFCRIILNTGEAFSRSVFECGASVFLNKGVYAEHSDTIIDMLSLGALRQNEINVPILDFSTEESPRHFGRERW